MKKILSYLLLVGILSTSIVFSLTDISTDFLKGDILEANIVSYFIYVLLLTSAVVFMPLFVMPIIPIAAGIFGPFTTALLSIVGWSFGAAIAFLISRYVGRPFIEKFMDLQKIDRLLQKVPRKTHFWFIILLRLTLPVDLVSYALGLAKSLRFSSYIAATIVGVTWFSFAFAYMGSALFEGNILFLIEISLASIGVFSLGWYILNHQK